MIKLYHGKTSVCSAKVRVGLAELAIEWTGQILNLGAGEQNADWYLPLNPKGVVPTLVDGELVVVESSVILEYLSDISGSRTFTPTDPQKRARAAMWLTECIDIHAAINTMTFATGKRTKLLAEKTPEQLEASISRMANPANAMKRRDILANGVASPYVQPAFFTLRLLFDRMELVLRDSAWILGDDYSIADTAIIAYLDRLDRLGLAGMWAERTPFVGRWLEASRARQSYKVAIEQFAGPVDSEREQNLSAGNWDQVNALWREYLNA